MTTTKKRATKNDQFDKNINSQFLKGMVKDLLKYIVQLLNNADTNTKQAKHRAIFGLCFRNVAKVLLYDMV